MFGADMTVLQPVAFFVRVGEYVFRFGSERQFDGGRDLVAQERTPFDLLAN